MTPKGARVANAEFLESVREAAGLHIGEDDAAVIHALALEYKQEEPKPAEHRKRLKEISKHAAALDKALSECDDFGLSQIVDRGELERLQRIAQSNADAMDKRQGRSKDQALRELAKACLEAYRNAGGQGIGVSTDGTSGDRYGVVLSLVTSALKACGVRHIRSNDTIRDAIHHANRQKK